MKYKYLLLLITLLVSNNLIFAEYFRQIGLSEGLTQPSVMAIYQDQLGRMWFGTREGINRYDGRQITPFKGWSGSPEVSSSVWLGNEVSSITADKSGNLFFLIDKDIIKFDIRSEKFSRLSQNARIPVLASFGGEIWYMKYDSLFYYPAGKEEPVFKLKTEITAAINCLTLLYDRICIGTRDGAIFIDRASQTRTQILKGIDIYQLFESSQKELWIGTRMHGLYRMNKEGVLAQIPYDEAVPSDANTILKFIVDECTDLASLLPVNYTNMPGGDSNLQRITKGMALALKSRVTLYMASPLYSTDNTQKWQDAAQAAYDLISQVGTLGYQLDKYFNLFGDVNNQSKEVIMCRPTGASTTFEARNFPMGVTGGSTSTCPTENLVSAYEMTDGNTFNWDNPEMAASPYENRDPRLAMTVVYNGMEWPKTTPVEIVEGGKNGQPLKSATSTGYYLRKYVNNSITFDTGETTTSKQHNWILFRYAEILLNYAEAMINAYGDPDYKGNYTLSAREAVNQVRARSDVRMPAYPAGMSKEAFLKRLKNERRVEFAFEGQRFWDLRRWKMLDEMKNIYKVRVVKEEDGTVRYTKELHSIYQIMDKMYFYPISNAELFKNHNLTQNSGW